MPQASQSTNSYFLERIFYILLSYLDKIYDNFDVISNFPLFLAICEEGVRSGCPGFETRPYVNQNLKPTQVFYHCISGLVEIIFLLVQSSLVPDYVLTII